MKNEKKYYLGLDIGTDSVGYAVTDTEYRLLKFHGSDAWGSHVFSAAALCDERRNFRSARRRLDRRQQRVQLLQEIFADEISKIDSRFSCVYQRVIYGVKIQQTGIFSLMIRNIQTFNIWENIRQFIILFRI